MFELSGPSLSSETPQTIKSWHKEDTIKRQEELYFFDFEHSGLDDLSKLIADWTLQPEYIFSEEEAEYLINKVKDYMTDNGWVQRYIQIRRLIRAKWVLIMLRSYRENKLKENEWEKILKYYEKTNEVIC